MITRRTALTSFAINGTALLSARSCLAQSPGAGAVRRDADRMSTAEIERFKNAYRSLIASGVMDQFTQAHGDMAQQQHEIAPDVPTLSFHFMPQPGGERFLPWHRAFLLEFERHMREAVSKTEGKEAAAAFAIPYWNFTGVTDLPAWIKDFLPAGIKAQRPEGLPVGHPGYSTPVGKLYDVILTRWPATYVVARTLPVQEHVDQLMAEAVYTSFTRRLEWAPTIRNGGPHTAHIISRLITAAAAAQSADASAQTVAKFAGMTTLPPEAWEPLMQAMARVGAIAAGTEGVPEPVRIQFSQLGDLIAERFLLGPHTLAHTWAAGHAPARPYVKGSPLYFHETAADPLFWLLHGQVDRLWSSWMARHTDKPRLTGKDAKFTPLPGGRTYDLQTLYDERNYGYRYDLLA